MLPALVYFVFTGILLGIVAAALLYGSFLMKNICFISTIAWPLKVYMGPHIRKVANFNKVTLVADRASVLEMSSFGRNVSYKDIKILRRINLLLDMKALFKLLIFFKANHFNCVHSIMPKAGLLSMAAAAAAGVPLRIHTFTGQIWVTRTGFSKQLLMFMDRLIVIFSTHILADSLLQREFLIANKIVKPSKIHVLGAGSIVGINTNRFLPNAEVRIKVRREFGIKHDAIVFLFVGRLNKDKGILDLLKAFERIHLTFPNSNLIIVGPDEDNLDEYILKTKDIFKNRIHREGFTECPERFMAAADVLCLPSYREGFNNVVLEAAASCLPTVGSRINGIIDSIIEGVTGILHEPGNVQELVLAMTTLAESDSLRLKMGVAAREHVIKNFSEVRITKAFEMFYRGLGVI